MRRCRVERSLSVALGGAVRCARLCCCRRRCERRAQPAPRRHRDGAVLAELAARCGSARASRSGQRPRSAAPRCSSGHTGAARPLRPLQHRQPQRRAWRANLQRTRSISGACSARAWLRRRAANVVALAHLEDPLQACAVVPSSPGSTALMLAPAPARPPWTRPSACSACTGTRAWGESAVAQRGMRGAGGASAVLA